MNRCREQFEEYCKKVNIRPEGDYAKDVYEFWQASWDNKASSASVPEVREQVEKLTKERNEYKSGFEAAASKYRNLKSQMQEIINVC